VSERFWPVGEAAQADYEQLRAAVLTGEAIDELLAARRFARRGLAGLIGWPQSHADYLGCLVGASRPAWSGADDPREAQLGDAYGFLLGRAAPAQQQLRVVGR
jgi:hypothetical protein